MPVLWIVFHKYYLSIGILYVVLGYIVTVLQNMWFSPWELKGQLSSQVLKAMLIRYLKLFADHRLYLYSSMWLQLYPI